MTDPASTEWLKTCTDATGNLGDADPDWTPLCGHTSTPHEGPTGTDGWTSQPNPPLLVAVPVPPSSSLHLTPDPQRSGPFVLFSPWPFKILDENVLLAPASTLEHHEYSSGCLLPIKGQLLKALPAPPKAHVSTGH